MTLILAVKARDGVVLAGDTQATTEATVPTRTTTRKLDDLHGRIAFGCSGSAGLRQRAVERLRKSVSTEDCHRPISELRSLLHKPVNTTQKEAVNEHVPIGTPLPAHIAFLFAGFSDGHPWIYEVAVDGREQVHAVAEAIGDARHYAVYGMVHHSHYRLGERDLKQVRMLAYRIVVNAIRTDASGSLGLGDVQVYDVTEKGAKALTPDEDQSMRDALNAWHEQERDIFATMVGETCEETPPATDIGEGIALD